MRLTIHNFRLGFATNSSSSHSIVLIPQDAVGRVEGIDSHSLASFGWDYFRLVSTEDKLRYLAAQFFSEAFSPEDRARFAATFEPHLQTVGDHMPEGDESVWSSGRDIFHVDHQSKMRAPVPFDASFAETMIRVFQNPRLVVLGGNDNSDGDNAVTGQEPSLLSGVFEEGSRIRTRLDRENVILFDTYSGTKTRFSVSDGPAPEYVKSTTPELVDLKITDYCGANCRFCYQGSTRDGVHAPLDQIKAILDMLSRQQVFEVAIGGGEPTDHPDFAEILDYAAAVNVKPNFTTLSNRWLTDETIMTAVGRHVGGIGVSCSSAKGLELFDEINAHFRWSPKISAQHVIGAVPLHVTGEFLEAAFAKKVPVLLLGFKPVGFGADYTRHDGEGADVPFFVRMAVNKGENVSLSVDTALIDQYPRLPEILGAPKALVTSPEGKFSCYIDAVRGTMAASSYGTADSADPLPATDAEFLATYATY